MTARIGIGQQEHYLDLNLKALQLFQSDTFYRFVSINFI